MLHREVVDAQLSGRHAGAVSVVHRRPDRGDDRVDRDVVAGPLLRDGPRPPHHRRLGGRVVRRAALAADARPRAEVDDAAAALAHVPEGGLVGVERPLHVDREDQVPLRVGDVLGRRAALDARHVGEHVEAAHGRRRAREHVVHLRATRDVTVVVGHAGARLGGDAPAALVVHVERRDARPFARVAPDGRRGDAARAAGHDDAPIPLTGSASRAPSRRPRARTAAARRSGSRARAPVRARARPGA